MLGAEALHVVGVAGDERRRHQVEEVEHEHLLRRVAHVRGIVDHQRLGMDALQQMRGRDVGHVERRVLAQQDHVQLGEIDGARVGKLEVAAGLVLDGERGAVREQPPSQQREVGRRVVEHRVPARCASSSRAKVESPPMSMRSIGSIWQATSRGMSSGLLEWRVAAIER